MCHFEKPKTGLVGWTREVKVCLRCYRHRHFISVDLKDNEEEDFECKESVQERADAFCENLGKLMDAYAFEIRKRFGEKGRRMFAWKYRSLEC